MGRRRYERDTGYGVARTGYYLVHLEAGQLSSLARFGSLRHLYLYLVGIDKIFGSHSETSRRHLFCPAVERYAVRRTVKTAAVLASLAGVAARSQLVHSKRESLVSLLADGSERHSSGHETAHYVLHRLHTVYRDGTGLEVEEIAEEYLTVLPVGKRSELLELLIAPQPRGELQGGDGLRVPGMPHPSLR